MQFTPTGGYHLFYRAKKAVKQGAHVLGPGIDTRSLGGYVVGPGSQLQQHGRLYSFVKDSLGHGIAEAPEHLLSSQDNNNTLKKARFEGVTKQIQSDLSKATFYLMDVAPAISGQGGDEWTYKVACRARDFGISMLACQDLMWVHFNPRCSPPWAVTELNEKIQNAYNYAKDSIGNDAPEAYFDVIKEKKAPHPILKFNDAHAFCIEGGLSTILWETKDAFGKFLLDRLTVGSFHDLHAPDTMVLGEKTVQTTRQWMKHSQRRTFERVVFKPGHSVPNGCYNLWNGFNEVPLNKNEKPTGQMVDALSSYKEHIYENVCEKIQEHADWVNSFFAHLIQYPGIKPLVALVLCGLKGVGKDSLVNCVGHLINRYYIMATNPRVLVGNFNAHLEHCLMIVCNEALWSGDKKAEGTLKDLITGDKHFIERKGKEIFATPNYTRVVIMGNEEWLVPATTDERRFAVFNIGTKRMQDNKFFGNMRKNMEAGGYRYLLTYLLNYKINADINTAPDTEGLYKQKLESHVPLVQWWKGCLYEGGILGSPSNNTGEWPSDISCEEFRDAFYLESRSRGIRSRLPDKRTIGKQMRKLISLEKYKKKDGGNAHWRYKLPQLSECRAAWEKGMHHRFCNDLNVLSPSLVFLRSISTTTRAPLSPKSSVQMPIL